MGRFLALMLVTLPMTAIAATDWSQPPLQCIENVIPAEPTRTCIDFSGVNDLTKDDPAVSAEELQWWKDRKFQFGYCRSKEVLRRERANPGSMTATAVQIAHMRMRAAQDGDLKINAVYDASERYGVPPHILTGAIMQESIFSNLGVTDDGGNFSCGIAQINLSEWCAWAEAQSDTKKTAMGWPAGGVNCNTEVSRSFVQPFHQIGLRRLGDLPEYRLEISHTQNIPIESVASAWSDASSSVKRRRYQITKSFLDNCGKPVDAIHAKAFQLKSLYTRVVPEGLKQHETYAAGEKFNLRCMRPLNSRVYPVQTAWVMAVGAYNAGGRVQDVMASTQRWSREDLARKSTFANFTSGDGSRGFNVQDLVASIYRAGRYNSSIRKIEMNNLSGEEMQWNWFKICILQRHVARVVQHVTRPGVTLVQNLEGEAGCSPTNYSRRD
jgi:hypothetical protein